MGDFEAFPQPGHDPDTRQPWFKKFTLPLGRSFQLVTATVVDDTDTPVPASVGVLVVDTVLYSQTNALTNEWTVSVEAEGGTSDTWVPIRYRYWLDGQDLSGPPWDDTTVLLHVLQK